MPHEQGDKPISEYVAAAWRKVAPLVDTTAARVKSGTEFISAETEARNAEGFDKKGQIGQAYEKSTAHGFVAEVLHEGVDLLESSTVRDAGRKVMEHGTRAWRFFESQVVGFDAQEGKPKA